LTRTYDGQIETEFEGRSGAELLEIADQLNALGEVRSWLTAGEHRSEADRQEKRTESAKGNGSAEYMINSLCYFCSEPGR
jgi:hypothetical protein